MHVGTRRHSSQDRDVQVGGTINDAYFIVLLMAVAGYALAGKGFAYAGVPPIFVGEIVLLCGLVTFCLPSMSGAVFYNVPMTILVAAMGWVVLRTVPYVGEYGVSALRDSVILMYGLFAFVVANLVLEDPARIERAVLYAGRFFGLFGVVGSLLFCFERVLGPFIPLWPGSGIPMLLIRGGEIGVHLGAAAVFAILGLKRCSVVWVIALLLGMAVVSAMSRGGMLAIAGPVALAVALSGRVRPIIVLALAASPVVALLYLSDIEVVLPGNDRTIRIGQLVDNAVSIAGTSGEDVLDGTKKWRLLWWSRIVEYTINGDYFWTGKGFGINLAISDGFLGTEGGDGPLLRSPHNAHMTILARAGVPGLLLWVILLASWMHMMLRRVIVSRRRGDEEWTRRFIFVTCYWTGALIHSSFDVALEGPMIGIVFWTLFGFGVGMTMTYDLRHSVIGGGRGASVIARAEVRRAGGKLQPADERL